LSRSAADPRGLRLQLLEFGQPARGFLGACAIECRSLALLGERSLLGLEFLLLFLDGDQSRVFRRLDRLTCRHHHRVAATLPGLRAFGFR
jgi:hypothetical protein